MRIVMVRDGIVLRGRASKVPPASATPEAELGRPRPCPVPSGPRLLDARLALPDGTPRASVLLLHGIGERLEYWSGAQQLLALHGIASLAVDYSGYGASEGAITPANLRQDAVAAYAALRRLVAADRPPFVLGLSLGTGVAVDAAPYLDPSPAGIVLCEAFSSLRSAAEAVCGSLPLLKYLPQLQRLALLLPDVYRTASAAASLRAPLLIVHSDADELFPVEMAREIFAAANPECAAELAVLHGYAHNDAYLRPSSGYWQPILDFLGRGPSPAS